MRLPANLTELHQRTQENLVTFLQAEVDLASTMVGIVNTTQNEDHRLRLLEAIQTAVNTVRYFERRILERPTCGSTGGEGGVWKNREGPHAQR